jgi:hypothetical protein
VSTQPNSLFPGPAMLPCCVCPNCCRGLGVRWVPAFAAFWKCRCGVTIHHTISTFLEAWLRPLVRITFMAGIALVLLLESAGYLDFADKTSTRIAWATGGGLGLTWCLLPIFIPAGLFLAFSSGVPFSPSDKTWSVIIGLAPMASFPLAAWPVFKAVLPHVPWQRIQ